MFIVSLSWIQQSETQLTPCNHLEKKSDPPINQGFSFRLRAILKSSKILDFEDFDFQNTQNQQFSKMKTLPSTRILKKNNKKYVFQFLAQRSFVKRDFQKSENTVLRVVNAGKITKFP